MKLLTLILKQTELISELNDELGNIGVVADSCQLRDTLAGNHKASRHQFTSHLLFYLVYISANRRYPVGAYSFTKNAYVCFKR